MHGGKNIENRTWGTTFRGRVLIHASKAMTYDEWLDGLELLFSFGISRAAYPGPEVIERGGIIGSVEIVDCVTESESPWFVGPYGYVLRDPQPCEFTPCQGALKFFQPQF